MLSDFFFFFNNYRYPLLFLFSRFAFIYFALAPFEMRTVTFIYYVEIVRGFSEFTVSPRERLAAATYMPDHNTACGCNHIVFKKQNQQNKSWIPSKAKSVGTDFASTTWCKFAACNCSVIM